MGPPEAGTKAYKTYLEKQRDRLRGVRKAGKKVSLANDASAMVSAAVLDTARRWSKDFDEQVRLKNQKLRESKLRESKGLLNRNGLLEEQRDQLKEALKSERAKNKQLTDQLADSTKELNKARAQARRWDLWWAWVSAKAKPALLAHLGRLGHSPPKSLGDRGWGGGQ
jgi:septal ring factor EnvC (AmiA/AmiB activator)